MRKSFAILALGLAIARPAFSQTSQNPPPVLQVDSDLFVKGVSHPLTVRLKTGTRLGALRFKLHLSPDLSVDSGATLTPGQLFTGAGDVRQFRVNGKIVDVVLASPAGVKGPGTLFTLPVTPSFFATSPQTVGITDVSAVDQDTNEFVPAATPVTGIFSIQETVNVGIGNAKGGPNLLATVPVTLTTASLLGGLQVTINAPDGLVIQGVDFGNSLFGSKDTRNSHISANGKKVDVILASTGNHTGPGLLFTLQVKIPAAATEGQAYTLTATNLAVADPSNNLAPVDPSAKTGTVTTEPLVGITVGSGTIHAGESIRLPVTLTSTAQLGSLRVILTTSGGLTFTSADFTGTLFGSGNDAHQFNVSADGKNLDVILASAAGVTGPGALYTAVLQAPASVDAVQTIAVSIVPITAYDTNEQPVPQGNLTEGSVTVLPACMAGDVNADKSIDMVDAVAVLRQIVGTAPPLTDDPLRAADANVDGSVDVFDAVKILRIAVELDTPAGACR